MMVVCEGFNLSLSSEGIKAFGSKEKFIVNMVASIEKSGV